MPLLCRVPRPWNGTSTPPNLVVTLALDHSTLQWHPPIAPHPLFQSWPSPSPPPTIAHYNGTLRWHPLMAPRPLPPKLVVTFRPNYGTLQWHPTMAPSNSTTSTPLKLVVTFPSNHSTLQWHPTMTPSSGTTSTAPCNGTLVPRPIRQSGSSPSPFIGSKNPYSYRYLGNYAFTQIQKS